MKRVLIVDCFDSFTYNIYHILEGLSNECQVVRYDQFKEEIAKSYSHVIFSPGPGIPEDYPAILSYLQKDHPEQLILGICMGMQCLAVSRKGKLRRLDSVKHGISSGLNLSGNSPLFKDLSGSIEVGHYHSWVVDEKSLPKEFRITSVNTDGLIMSIENEDSTLAGLQFHPESIMTGKGVGILKNWMNLVRWS